MVAYNMHLLAPRMSSSHRHSASAHSTTRDEDTTSTSSSPAPSRSTNKPKKKSSVFCCASTPKEPDASESGDRFVR